MRIFMGFPSVNTPAGFIDLALQSANVCNSYVTVENVSFQPRHQPAISLSRYSSYNLNLLSILVSILISRNFSWHGKILFLSHSLFIV